jgi:glutamine amidotransferase
MITIIDYNAGNIVSIKNMLNRLGLESKVSSDINDIVRAEKLILPGVGHFDYGMKNLIDSGLASVLSERVLERKVPILGICLGAQLFTNHSEEGVLPGLGWFPSSKTVKFKISGEKLKIPHMGWADVQIEKESRLFKGMDKEQRFYFVHSYHLECSNNADILASAKHGIKFAAALEHKNIVGVQFHPEKSHKFGMHLLRNFIELY